MSIYHVDAGPDIGLAGLGRRFRGRAGKRADAPMGIGASGARPLAPAMNGPNLGAGPNELARLGQVAPR